MKKKKHTPPSDASQLLEKCEEVREKRLPDLISEIAGGLEQLQRAERTLGEQVLAEARRRTRARRSKKRTTPSGRA